MNSFASEFVFGSLPINNQNEYIKCINIVVKKTLFDIMFVLISSVQIFYMNPHIYGELGVESNLCLVPCERIIKEITLFFKYIYCKDNLDANWNAECSWLQELAMSILEHVVQDKRGRHCYFSYGEHLSNKFFHLKSLLVQHVEDLRFPKDILGSYLNSITTEHYKMFDGVVEYNLDPNSRIYNYDGLWIEYFCCKPLFFNNGFETFVKKFDKLLTISLNGVCVGTVFTKVLNCKENRIENICDSFTLKVLHYHMYKTSCHIGDRIIQHLEAEYEGSDVKILVNPIMFNPKWKEKLERNPWFCIC